MRPSLRIARGVFVLVAGLVALASLLVIGLTRGVNAVLPEADVPQLHARVASLIPDDAEVFQREDGGCLELAPHPDCSIAAVRLDGSLRSRAQAFAARAEQSRWACTPFAFLPGGATMSCDLDSYTARVQIWPDPVQSCEGRPLNDCPGPYDHVQVIRHG
jgi:hypothetical protein